jgi:hypothetical protein
MTTATPRKPAFPCLDAMTARRCSPPSVSKPLAALPTPLPPEQPGLPDPHDVRLIIGRSRVTRSRRVHDQ